MSAEPMTLAGDGPGAAPPPRPPIPDEFVLYRLNHIGGYVTLQQAAEMFGVHRERLQIACAQGRLPGRKVPGTLGRPPKDPNRPPGLWVVHLHDVADFLATSRRGRVPNGEKPQLTTATRRRKARELEKGRLAGSAARAARRALADRERLEEGRRQLAASDAPAAAGRSAVDIHKLSAHWNETKVRNGIRVMAELERQEEAERLAAAQRAAYEAEHGPLDDAALA